MPDAIPAMLPIKLLPLVVVLIWSIVRKLPRNTKTITLQRSKVGDHICTVLYALTALERLGVTNKNSDEHLALWKKHGALSLLG